jgi:GTP-binding protein
MFIDRVKLDIRAGKGGNGAISFLRLKFMEHGGPDGGGGGRGGSVYFQATTSETTLYQFKFTKKIVAEDGEKGQMKDRYGRSADDVYVKVPVGTIVIEDETNRILADLKEDGQVALIAKGGRGGRGNSTFKSSVNRSPKIAENGDPGEQRKVRLELKLLADVGLVGFPSVGKSSILSVISNAKPQIADYEFTTIVPNLGVVYQQNELPFIVADLPGLIEGASQGKGLGLQFLRHIERCKVIVHVIDMSREADPYKSYLTINEELQSYSEILLQRPTIIAASKMDEPLAQANLKKLKSKIKDKRIIPVSLLTGEGLEDLVDEAFALIKQFKPVEEKVEVIEEKLYKFDNTTPIFTIHRKESHIFILQGEEIETQYKKFNLSSDQGLLSLLNYLRKIKVEDALEAKGIQEGDTVILCDFEFTYFG